MGLQQKTITMIIELYLSKTIITAHSKLFSDNRGRQVGSTWNADWTGSRSRGQIRKGMNWRNATTVRLRVSIQLIVFRSG